MRRSIVTTLLLTALLVLVLSPPATLAQDRPTAADQRETIRTAGFPDAADLGPGWIIGTAFTQDATSAFPFDSHSVTYTEAYGSRIGVYVVSFDGKDGSDAFDAISNRIAFANTVLQPSDFAPSARELRDLDDPAGCDDVERANGEDPLYFYFTGIIGCLDEANGRAIWVAVSGLYDDERFQDAAEPVLELVLDTEPR